MPIYEYECTSCRHRTEVMQRLSDPPLAECPECGAAVKKLVSAPAFQFKGSGWYVTDYARKGSENGGKKDDAKESKAESGSDSRSKSETGSSSGTKSDSGTKTGSSSSTAAS